MARSKSISTPGSESCVFFDPAKYTLAGKIDLSFNKSVDIRRVEPVRVVLISEMLASGVVPADSADLEYNDISDPDNIEGTVRNVFDAIDKQREIAALGKHAKDNPEPTQDPIPTPDPNPQP